MRQAEGLWAIKFWQLQRPVLLTWKNPMGTVAEGEGDAVAILNRNEPAFYCVPPKLYAYYRELAEDAELNAVADERMKNPEIVKVNLDDLWTGFWP